MKIQRYKINLMFMTLPFLAMILTSCGYKDFNEYEGLLKTKVIIDYSRMDTVSNKPEQMKVVFYSTDMDYTYVCFIKDSAVVEIPVGNYKVFTFNDNSELNRFSVSFGDHSLNEILMIYTDEADSRGILHKDSLDKTVYYDYPDRTFADSKPFTVKGDIYTTKIDDNRLVLYPEEKTRRVEVIADGIKNQKYIKGVRMTIDSVQREYIPELWQYPNQYVPLVFDASMLAEQERLEGSMNIFGITNGHHYLQIFIQGNGFNRILRFDVTEQVKNQFNSKETMKIYVNANYDAFDDYPIDVSGGINIGVEDWYNEDIPANL